VFQQTNGIAMNTNWPPLLADLFLHAYEARFLQGFLNNNDSAYSQNNGFLDRAQLLMQKSTQPRLPCTYVKNRNSCLHVLIFDLDLILIKRKR
jgi:hypothetical protein